MASTAKKKHRFKAFKTKVLRAAEVNRQLKKLKIDDQGEARKKIIEHAITVRGVHPDKIKAGCGFVPDTLLAECVEFDTEKSDREYAAFLIKHGANVRVLHKFGNDRRPLIYFAKTVEMAQLLAHHGAHQDIRTWGPELLGDMGKKEKDSALIPFFVSWGAKINRRARDGSVPLMSLVGESMLEVQRAQAFMEHGVLLDTKSAAEDTQNGYTVPQYLKEELAAQNEKSKECVTGCCVRHIQHLQSLRQMFIFEQNKRNINACKQILAFVIPVPDVCALVGIYGVPYVSYEELEAVSVIPPESPRFQRTNGYWPTKAK